MSEEWRIVPDSNGRYEASDAGQIRGVYRKTLRPATTESGYLRLGIAKRFADRRPLYVHRIIAETFIGPCPHDYEINHKDGNKTNNCPDNLEYVSHRENIKHSIEVLGNDPKAPKNQGSVHGMARLTETDVVRIRAMRARGIDLATIARSAGVSVPSISMIVNRKTWRHI